MAVKLKTCPACGRPTLMAKVTLGIGHYDGGTEHVKALYCPQCGKTYTEEKETRLKEFK